MDINNSERLQSSHCSYQVSTNKYHQDAIRQCTRTIPDKSREHHVTGQSAPL